MAETYAGSDTPALRPVTDRFVYLEEGDMAELVAGSYRIVDRSGEPVLRPVTRIETTQDSGDHDYEHYMLKEIHEQPKCLDDTLAMDWRGADCFGEQTDGLLGKVAAVQIIACGTSYHAELVARHWIEAEAVCPPG